MSAGTAIGTTVVVVVVVVVTMPVVEVDVESAVVATGSFGLGVDVVARVVDGSVVGSVGLVVGRAASAAGVSEPPHDDSARTATNASAASAALDRVAVADAIEFIMSGIDRKRGVIA
jgi:hypothetical protein